jgi:phosphatidate phosphatase APP1
MNWQSIVGRIAVEIEEGLDRLKDRPDRRDADLRPARIVPYRGYGTPAGVRVRGRVLRGKPPTAGSPRDRWWVNLGNTYRRMESDEVPHAHVNVRFGGSEVDAHADEEGHFDVLVRPVRPPARHRFWHEAQADLIRPGGESAAVMVAVPDRARFGIISDLDDTVVRTGATNMIRVAREVLFGNVHTRIPFPGVGAFYRALHRFGDDGRNPLFYVSSSPWNLYDVLNEFLRLHDIPMGPMDLRDWGIRADELLPTGHTAHKRLAIDRILHTYPDLPFILIGDSGQQDPEIYRGVVHDHPDRILGIYIRSVVNDPARVQAVDALADELADHAGIDLVRVEDTVEAARHAARRGWIAARDLGAVTRTRMREREVR